MPFEEGVTMVWVIIFALMTLIVMIGFYIYFRPSIEGGWINLIASIFKELLLPIPPV